MDEIIRLLDEVIRETEREKYYEHVIINQKLLNHKKIQKDSLHELITGLSIKYGILDYLVQTEEVTKGYMKFLLEGKKGKNFEEVKELYDKGDLATVIVTDGNQTAGEDYEYRKYDSKIFPVLVGDTTKYQDVQITQLNVNKFSYLKNKFPVEALILYEGDKSVKTKFTLSQNGKKIYNLTPIWPWQHQKHAMPADQLNKFVV